MVVHLLLQSWTNTLDLKTISHSIFVKCLFCGVLGFMSELVYLQPNEVKQLIGAIELTTILKIYSTWAISAMTNHFDEKSLIKGEY